MSGIEDACACLKIWVAEAGVMRGAYMRPPTEKRAKIHRERNLGFKRRLGWPVVQ